MSAITCRCNAPSCCCCSPPPPTIPIVPPRPPCLGLLYSSLLLFSSLLLLLFSSLLFVPCNQIEGTKRRRRIRVRVCPIEEGIEEEELGQTKLGHYASSYQCWAVTWVCFISLWCRVLKLWKYVSVSRKFRIKEPSIPVFLCQKTSKRTCTFHQIIGKEQADGYLMVLGSFWELQFYIRISRSCYQSFWELQFYIRISRPCYQG